MIPDKAWAWASTSGAWASTSGAWASTSGAWAFHQTSVPAAGAIAIVSRPEAIVEGVPRIADEEPRRAFAQLAARFFAPFPDISVAVTGTNGKTSTVELTRQLWRMAGQNAASIGTLGVTTADEQVKTGLTTPDIVTFLSNAAGLKREGVTHLAFEASSHGLSQYRTEGLPVGAAAFTNLSRDHLDYHGDINAYAAAKSRLFAMQGLQHAVINCDDSVGRVILANLDQSIQAYSFSLQNNDADIYCSTIGLSPEGLRASVVTPWGQGEISSPLLGKFNLANLLAVIGAAGAQGFALTDILRLIPSLRAVPGRMELVDASAQPAVVVDYAHTPDALEKALQALRVHCQGNLWAVFGCGGDRDIGKRPEMGEIARRCADKVVVTSDNPRTESPQQIIDHILQGTGREVIVDSDRRAAIRQAIFTADKNDVVLIAGKGHEDYQILGAQRLPFSDQAEARLALRELQATAHGGGDQ